LKTKEAALKRENGVDGPVVAEEFEVKDDLLFYENRWVIPDDSALKLRILHGNYNSKVAGHFDQFKTIERVKQNFFCNKMEDNAITFEAAIRVSEIRPAGISDMGCCNL
jgi:hypothetical protein